MITQALTNQQNRFVLQTIVWLVFLALVSYYLPALMVFYLVCGLYDVLRNSNLDYKLLYRYFFGNGVPTWALAPFNVAMDVLTLPYINKKVYRLEDLPVPYLDEINDVLAIAKAENLEAKLAEKMKAVKRGMIFFKWYGRNIQNSIEAPRLHKNYRYIKTIGVSIFSQQEWTAEHFGPLRATLRVLYNINDIQDRSAYIKVRNIENHWCDNKLFIFDDTLSHQSFNQTDRARYCLFVDILRPSYCRQVLNWIVELLGTILQKTKFVFYGSWVPLR